MEMEIEALCQNFAKKDPKLLVGYVRSAASGEVPFFPVTLSLVYGKLAGTAFPKGSSDSNPENPREGLTITTTPNPFQASGIASVTALPTASDDSSSTAPTPAFTRPTATIPVSPFNRGLTTLTSTPTNQSSLMCVRCRGYPQLEQLYNRLHCPWCPKTGKNGLGVRGRPFMACSECNLLRTARVDKCLRCGATFV